MRINYVTTRFQADSTKNTLLSSHIPLKVYLNISTSDIQPTRE